MVDLAQHLKSQIFEGNQIKKNNVVSTISTRTSSMEEDGEVKVKALCDVSVGEENGQVKLESWAKKAVVKSTVQISKTKISDLTKNKNAVLKTIIIPALKDFIVAGNASRKDAL